MIIDDLRETNTEISKIICQEHDNAVKNMENWKQAKESDLKYASLIHWRAVKFAMRRLARKVIELQGA